MDIIRFAASAPSLCLPQIATNSETIIGPKMVLWLQVDRLLNLQITFRGRGVRMTLLHDTTYPTSLRLKRRQYIEMLDERAKIPIRVRAVSALCASRRSFRCFRVTTTKCFSQHFLLSLYWKTSYWSCKARSSFFALTPRESECRRALEEAFHCHVYDVLHPILTTNSAFLCPFEEGKMLAKLDVT